MDLKVILTNNGGDLVKNPKDLAVVTGFENFPLLALFGGNIQENTPTTRVVNQTYEDWWGNNLLLPKDASRQFNSDTERMLNNVALNSFGLVQIEDAIKRDLSFMDQFANIKIVVRLIGPDRILIGIQIEQKKIVYIWDNTSKELIDVFALISSPGFTPGSKYFEQPFFDDFFE